MKNRKHKLFSNCNKGDFELNSTEERQRHTSVQEKLEKQGKGDRKLMVLNGMVQPSGPSWDTDGLWAGKSQSPGLPLFQN